MPVSRAYVDYVQEQLAGLGSVSSRRMFGGVGLYAAGKFFGLLDDNDLYFKVDASNRDEYLARGCEPFRPFKDRPEQSMSYYRVPAEVIEDAEQLVEWARRSVRVASSQPPPRARKPRS